MVVLYSFDELIRKTGIHVSEVTLYLEVTPYLEVTLCLSESNGWKVAQR